MKDNGFNPLLPDNFPGKIRPAEAADKGKSEITKHFGEIPDGNFLSSDPRVASISITRPAQKSESQIFATIFYSENQKQYGSTWTILKDGNIIVPSRRNKNFPLSDKDAHRLILGTLEKIKFDFWHTVDFSILDQQDPSEKTEEPETNATETKKAGVEPARLELLQDHPSSLFGIMSKKKGFSGYHGVIFPGFIVLESPWKNNAVYFMDFAKSVELPGDKSSPSLKAYFSNPETRKHVESDYVEPIFNNPAAVSRQGLKSLGAKRLWHKPETWRKNISQEIESRLAGPQT